MHNNPRPPAVVLFLLTALCPIHGLSRAGVGDTAATARHRGHYYDAEVRPAGDPGTDEILFRFRGLQHRTPWCMLLIQLDRSVDLGSGGQLLLEFAEVSDDIIVKIEVRDEDSADLTNRSALRNERLSAGSNRLLRVPGKKALDGLDPDGWQRRSLWPNWQRVRYVGVIVESRVNQTPTGLLHLKAVSHTTADGKRTALKLHGDLVRYFEYIPAKVFRSTEVTGPLGPSPGTTATPAPQAGVTLPAPTTATPPAKPEATVAIKRDDPSSALFVSGAGFKLDLEPRSVVGVSGQTELSEKLHRIDALLINDFRKRPLAADAGIPFDPRSMLSEPIDVRRTVGSVIFDDPDRTDLPRLTYTFEDTDVDSDSSIQLDFDLEVHELALLWTTPYLGNGRRYRLTFEPIYQYLRTTGISEFDVVTMAPVVPRRQLRDVHRGLINTVLRDEWNQREYFFQVIYGRVDNIVDRVDETELVISAQWRQWYGAHQTAFSTVGAVYRDHDFDSAVAGLDGRSRDFEIFGNLIVELDKPGSWRWFNQATYNHHDIDLVVFDPVVVGLVSANRVFDFYRLESRLTFEAVRDVDLSLGLEHSVEDSHRFDSVGLVARASVFNQGPFRAEITARRTWYHNLDDAVNTLFLEIHFAR